MKTRTCAACGADCTGKKVWAKWSRYKVICYGCGQTHAFNADGQVVKIEPRVRRAK